MTFRRFAKSWFLFCAGCIGLSILTSLGQENVPVISGVLGAIGLVGAFLLIIPVACIWTKRFVDAGFDALKVATTPVPSPQQIAAGLEAEWGRPATVEEVAAVRQMIASRRNEAAVIAGLSFGAIFLAARHDHL